jgi:histidine triad (HIT) family protein
METLADLNDNLVQPVFSDVRLLSRAVEQAMEAEGTFVAINNKISQSVPHLHVHVVPRRKKDGLKGFFWPRIPYRDAAHMDEVTEKLRAAVNQLRSGSQSGPK